MIKAVKKKIWGKIKKNQFSIVNINVKISDIVFMLLEELQLTDRLFPRHGRNRKSFSLATHGDGMTYNGILVDRFHCPSRWN